MSTVDDTVQRIRDRVASIGPGRWLLAVSGGMDSMVLLDAASSVFDGECLAVASFDHGTGPWATDAAGLVANAADRRGIRCITGHAGTIGRSESEWRAERWRFLRGAAEELGARVATAHTADDQLETILIRELRGAGPRGLAGLLASSAIARPLLGTSRKEVAAYARTAGVPYVNDPSNADRKHLRNRIRHDLLPALERIVPGFGDSMMAVAKKAAVWRAQMEALALTFPMMTESPDSHSFERASLRRLPPDQLGCLWPALAARAGVVLDRRGTARLAEFTIGGETGQQIQLAGGVRVHMERRAITFRRVAANG